ncbi:outer membrane beta-barrel protein [Candidatus Dependentiae bacterium]|nr:outer membrane beta-barrel protein [Candidatus Dependentiae bacterium]
MKNLKILVFLVTLLLSVSLLPENAIADGSFQFPYNVSLYLLHRFKPIGENAFDFPVGTGHHNMLITVSVGRLKMLKKPINLGTDLTSNLEYGGSFTLNYCKNRNAVVTTNSYFISVIMSCNDTITTTTSLSFNGYFRLNLGTQNKLVPFIGATGGMNIRSTETETESSAIDLVLSTDIPTEKSSSSDKSTSFSVGLQAGANYFFSDSISFNFQYNINVPMSGDEKTIGMMIFGMSYWYSGKLILW